MAEHGASESRVQATVSSWMDRMGEDSGGPGVSEGTVPPWGGSPGGGAETLL